MQTKEISGFEGLYVIDDTGNVASVKKRKGRVGVIKPTITENGYCRITLRNNGRKRTVYIHRLVAEAFIPNTENKPCVNHIDGDKTNNSVSNLEWCTYSENMKHAVSKGLNAFPNLKGELHPQSKLNAELVREIRAKYASGEKPLNLAKEYGVTKEQIYNIIHFKHWKNT